MKKFNLKPLFIVSLVCLLSSCDSLFQGSLLAQKIQEEIDYEKSLPSKITISSNAAATAQLIPAAGFYDKKITDRIELNFEANPGYRFISWIAEPEDALSFDDVNSNRTSATVLVQNTEISISPKVIDLLKVSKNLPSYSATGEARDSSISVEFSDELNADSFFYSKEEQNQIISANLASKQDFITDSQGLCYAYKQYGEKIVYKNIAITCDDSNYLEYFGVPTVSNKTLVIPVNTNNYIPVDSDKTKNICVTISKNVTNTNNISMEEDYSWTYKINASTLEKLSINPECDAVTGSFTLNSNTKYSINESFTLTFITTPDYDFKYWTYDKTKLYVEEPKSPTTKVIVLAGSSSPTPVTAVCSLKASADRVNPEWGEIKVGTKITDLQNGINLASTTAYSEWQEEDYASNHFAWTSENMNIWFQISATDDNSGVKECTVKETMYELVNGSKPETVVNTQTITFEEGEENSANVCIPYQSKTTEDGIIKLEFYDLTDKNGNVLDATNTVYLIKDSGFTLEGVMLKNEFDPADSNNYIIREPHENYYSLIDESKIESFSLKIPEQFYLKDRAKNISAKFYTGTDYNDISTPVEIGNINSEFTYNFTIASDSINGVYEKDLYIRVCISDDYNHNEDFYTILPRTAKWAFDNGYKSYNWGYWRGLVNASENAKLYKVNRKSLVISSSEKNYHDKGGYYTSDFELGSSDLFYSVYNSDNSILYGKATGIVSAHGSDQGVQSIFPLPSAESFEYQQTPYGTICKITPVFSGSTFEDYFSNSEYSVFAKVTVQTISEEQYAKLVFFERKSDNTFIPANLILPENSTVSSIDFGYSNQYSMNDTSLGTFETKSGWEKKTKDSKSNLYSIPLTYDGKGYLHITEPIIGSPKSVMYYYKKLSDIENLDISIFDGKTDGNVDITFGPMILIKKNVITQEEVEATWPKLSPRFDISSKKYIPMDFPILYLPEPGDYAVFVKAIVDDSGTEIELFDGFRLNWENHKDYGAGYKETGDSYLTAIRTIKDSNYNSDVYIYDCLYYAYSYLEHYDSNYTSASSGSFFNGTTWEPYKGIVYSTMIKKNTETNSWYLLNAWSPVYFMYSNKDSVINLYNCPKQKSDTEFYTTSQKSNMYDQNRWSRYLLGEADTMWGSSINYAVTKEGHNVVTYSPNLVHKTLSGDITTYTNKSMLDSSLSVMCYFDTNTLVETYSSPINWGDNVHEWDLHTPSDRITNTKEIKSTSGTPVCYNIDFSEIPDDYYYCVIAHLSDGSKSISAVRKKYAN